MKTMFVAAAAALSLGVGSAYAGDGQGPSVGYVYPGSIYAGSVYAEVQTPARKTPPVATAQNGQTVRTYVTHSLSQGVWLFPPSQAGGGSN